MSDNRNFLNLPNNEIEKYIKIYKKTIRTHNKNNKIKQLQYNIQSSNKQTNIPNPKTTQYLITYCIENEQYDNALIFCELWCDYFPNSIEAKNTLCTILNILYRFNEVLNITSKILKTHPDNIETILNRAIATEQIGEPLKAVELLQYALEIDNTNIRIIYMLATLYKYMNNFNEAIKYYNIYLEIIKKRKDIELITIETIYHEIANCYIHLTKYDKAIDIYNKLLEETPYNKELWYFLANLYILKGQIYKAKEYLEFVLSIDNNSETAITILAEIYSKLHDYGNSLYYYNKLLDINPDNINASICIATIFIQKKQYKLAKKTFISIIPKLNKKNNLNYSFFTFYGLGLCNYLLNNNITALKYYLKTLQIYPYETKIINKIQKIYLSNLKKFSNQATNILTNNKTINQKINLITKYINNKDYESALELIISILQKHPFIPDLLYLTAKIYAIKKKNKIASYFFSICFNIDNSFVIKYNNEISTILNNKNIEKLNKLLFFNK